MTKNVFDTPFFARFRTKLLLFVLLLLVPALLLTLHGNLEERRLHKEHVRENAVSISRLAAANQAQFIRNTRQLLATVAEFPFLVLATNAPFCDVHFQNLLKLSPDYMTFGLIELNGKVFASAVKTNRDVNLGDRSYFRRVVQTKQYAIGDFQIGRLTGQPSLNFGYPIFDERKRLRRVLFASLKLSLLSDAISQVQLPAGGAITIIDRGANVLARFPEPEKWVGRSVGDHPMARWILAGNEGVIEMVGLDGVPRLHAVTRVSENNQSSIFVFAGFPLSAS